ncbi:hypothetical protein KR018_005424, partial [Drosophila ironensis]
MHRIYVDNYAPKYYSGKWSWDTKNDCLHFQPHSDLEQARERYIITNGFKFLRTINQEEELIFRQDYMRLPSTLDGDTVILSDIRDLVLYLMPPEMLTFHFITFMHTNAVHELLHSLVIYFEYFLRLAEFIMIRRDELSGNMAQIQSAQTTEMKQTYSVTMGQYRMLVARNYCEIVKGQGDMAPYYHLNSISNISATIRDKAFHENFLAVAIQIVWICMHRRAYFIIEMEMNRLFCSEHFVTMRPEYPRYSAAERSMLYGKNKKNYNYRAQESPLIQELKLVPSEDLPILWIGKRKYRGTDLGLAAIELEYIVPGSQLRLIDVAHGILGHPKNLYNTLLQLDWEAARWWNFSEQYDPYHIIRRPYLDIPRIGQLQLRRMYQYLEHFYMLRNKFEHASHQLVMKWVKREAAIQYYKATGLLTNVVSRCENELATPYTHTPVDTIIARYFKIMAKIRKQD